MTSSGSSVRLPSNADATTRAWAPCSKRSGTARPGAYSERCRALARFRIAVASRWWPHVNPQMGSVIKQSADLPVDPPAAPAVVQWRSTASTSPPPSSPTIRCTFGRLITRLWLPRAPSTGIRLARWKRPRGRPRWRCSPATIKRAARHPEHKRMSAATDRSAIVRHRQRRWASFSNCASKPPARRIAGEARRRKRQPRPSKVVRHRFSGSGYAQ